MTIVEFLLARIAEDEEQARYLTGFYSGDGDLVVSAVGWGDVPDTPLVDYSAARVLRECEAKRRIVELHREGLDEDAGGNRFSTGCAECGGQGYGETVEWPCPTLLAVARIHSDHPDYREEWRP